MNLSLFEQLALALGLAFFFGLAFEDYYGRVKEARPGGVRTFPLLALAGSVLYLLDPQRLIPLTAGLLCVGAWLAIFYFRRTTEKNARGEAAVGFMVPVCNVIAFLLGPAALAQPPWLPAGVTAAAVLLLTNRDQLHRFAREIEIPELVTAGKFLVLTGLVLPLLPNQPISSLTSITPRQAWLALIACRRSRMPAIFFNATSCRAVGRSYPSQFSAGSILRRRPVLPWHAKYVIAPMAPVRCKRELFSQLV
jgi:hypothetical protein